MRLARRRRSLVRHRCLPHVRLPPLFSLFFFLVVRVVVFMLFAFQVVFNAADWPAQDKIPDTSECLLS
jgi:hypothetical protein